MTHLTSPIYPALLFLAMLLCIHFGRMLGLRRRAMDPEGATVGLGTIEAAVLALLGLLIAFTFSGAAGRFDSRRHLVVEEANDIGTAYLRIDLPPADRQAAM